MSTNYERIKATSLDEMAKELTHLMCKECSYVDNWKACKQVVCWCHPANGYQSYKQWLQAESENNVNRK